jgi:Cof subfamily protein (haloacid dehalogenase superfamily)
MAERAIRLVLSDVDGTLVTPDKKLTERSIDAVRHLGDAGIAFAITSGRPPRGVSMLIDPLRLTTPIAAFNGGVVVNNKLEVIEEHTVPDELVEPLVTCLEGAGLSVWVFAGTDWFVRDVNGPHVQREVVATQFQPQVASDLGSLSGDVAKIVGVIDNETAMFAARKVVAQQFGTSVSATSSQPYYLDVTHRDANKGWALHYFATALDLDPSEIATIGDMENDILMFEPSGLSIAMGNGAPDVQAAADHVTSTNADEGFAVAVEQFILAD